MIKKLRRQFMFSNLFIVTVIIAGFFSALMFISYTYERQQAEEVLALVLDSVVESTEQIIIDEKKLLASIDEEDTLNRIKSIAIIAQTDAAGNIIVYGTEDEDDLSAEFVEKAVGYALAHENAGGRETVSGYILRYLKVPNHIGGYKIAFSDASTEFVTLQYMGRVYFFASLFFFALMFIISDYMAHKAIAPVARSWDNQTRFVADASHELKTPLTVILANMDIMSSNPESTVEEQKKWIENTKSEAKRMTELVNDMLFLARGDAGVEQTYNFMDVNLSALVEDCVLTFEAVAFERGVEFDENITPDIMVKADEGKLKQAIIILIDNALKYVNEKGRVLVSLKYVGRVPGKQYVKISVMNTGAAIPKEKQKYVFERFFRVDESRTRDQGGYGLGLSIAHKIMTAHDGRIALDYSDVTGTCFSLTLPIKQANRFSLRKRKK